MAAATKEPKKVKKGFKMPHLFWIMICLLFVSSLLTYVIPAGQFMTDPETGKILGDQFQYLGAQTPVSPLQVLLLLIDLPDHQIQEKKDRTQVSPDWLNIYSLYSVFFLYIQISCLLTSSENRSSSFSDH